MSSRVSEALLLINDAVDDSRVSLLELRLIKMNYGSISDSELRIHRVLLKNKILE